MFLNFSSFIALPSTTCCSSQRLVEFFACNGNTLLWNRRNLRHHKKWNSCSFMKTEEFTFSTHLVTYNSSCIVNVLNSCHGNFQAPKYASAAHIFFTVAIHFLSCVKQRMLSKMGCGQKIVKLHNRGSSQPPAVNPIYCFVLSNSWA